jgi:Mrp family chromosome partitioning ATPase
MVLGNSAYQQEIHKSGSGAWTPIYVKPNLAVMSISFMLQDPNQAVVWRGPRKNALIQQFLTEVDWTGDTDGLDYLIVDTPPGTSDEHISTVQYLQRANAVSGAIVVTTPEEVSLADVRKELNFCTKTNVKVLGIVENMSNYQTWLSRCSFINAQGMECTDNALAMIRQKCPELLDMVIHSEIFSTTHGGAEKMAADYGAPFWGKLPLDPDLLKACEDGKAFCEVKKDALAATVLVELARKLTEALPVDMSSS